MAKGYLYNRNRRLSHLGNVSTEAFERGRREAPVCLLNWGQTKPCKMGVPVSRHRLPSESVRHPPKRSVIALSWKTASIDHGWVDLHQLDAGYTKEICHD